MTRSIVIWLALVLASAPARADLGTEVKCPKGSVFDPSHGCVKRNVPVAARYIAALEALNSDPKRALGLLEAACEARYAPACLQLGVMYLSGRGRAVVKDEARAQALFEKACDLGEGVSCMRRGYYVLGLEPARARVWFGKGCANDDALSCSALGSMFFEGNGGPKDAEAARKLLGRVVTLIDKECPLGGGRQLRSQPSYGVACLARGALYSRSDGVDRDPAKALASYQLACDARIPEGCVEAAKQYDAQRRAPETLKLLEKACLYDDAQACATAAVRASDADHKAARPLELVQRACELDARKCEVLAHFYDVGLGGLARPDSEKATALVKSLCDAGEQSACVAFAKRVRAGMGMAADPERADRILDGACGAKEPEACSALAQRYAATRTDDAKGYRAAQAGCTLGSGHACYLAGWMIAKGRRGDAAASGAAVATQALPLYEAACDKGSMDGCYEAAELHAVGTGTPKDVARAVARYRKACDDAERPVPAACVALANRYTAGSDGLNKDVDQAIRLLARACASDHEGACGWVPYNATQPAQIKDVAVRLRPACDTGEHDLACHALGQLLLFRGSNDEKHAGYDLMVRACGRKHSPSCLAQLQALLNGVGTIEDKPKAEQLGKQYCDAGDGQACELLAIMAGDANDGERELRYADRACTLKTADGCNTAGFRYYTGSHGTRWNITVAADYYIKACELGGAVGCANQAELARFGVLGPADQKKAAELYKKSCELSEWIGCAGWAHYVLRGEGGQTQDLPRATRLFRGACDADVGSACVELADLLEHDGASASEIARLRLKAFELTRKQAESNPGYMYWLGVYFRDGMATRKDDRKALEWFAKACDGFDPMGCIAAGQALSRSPDAKDREQAKAYYTRACAAGVDDGCNALKAPARGAGAAPVNPATLGARSRGCGAEVAPGGGGGGVLVLLAVGWVARRRARRRWPRRRPWPRPGTATPPAPCRTRAAGADRSPGTAAPLRTRS